MRCVQDSGTHLPEGDSVTTRCPDCGRFARHDAYYARHWCDYCDRKVEAPPPVALEGLSLREGIKALCEGPPTT